MSALFTIDQRVKHTVAGRTRYGRIISFMGPAGQTKALVAWDGGNATPILLTELEPF